MVSKERDLPRTELERLAEGLANTFIQRRDLYARQMDDGRYVCVPRPLKPGHLLAHLRGELTLGVYVLDAQSRARFVAYDADDDQRMGQLTAMAASLADQGVPGYLERSRRGGHLWLFLPQAVPGKLAREFGQGLLSRYGIGEVELFPKQDRLKDGPGSLIRLPFGVHRKTGQRYGFITPDGQPLAPTLSEQIRLLSAPQTVPMSFFEECRSVNEKPESAAPGGQIHRTRSQRHHPVRADQEQHQRAGFRQPLRRTLPRRAGVMPVSRRSSSQFRGERGGQLLELLRRLRRGQHYRLLDEVAGLRF